jgi:hypothetical protein
LAPSILGVAKIVSGGTAFIRGYGTFPHPNPFSAFLVAGILITIYLLTQSTNKKISTLYSTLLFLNILGLTVTFSRGAYLALALGLSIFFGLLFSVIARRSASDLSAEALAKVDDKAILSKKEIATSASQGPGLLAMTAMVITLASILISFFLFKPFLLTRATFFDQATMDRKFYDITGVKMAVAHPIFGLGLGESLLHMEQYSGKTLAPWDKQPPHNYFILAAAELGIPAMLILVWIFFSHLYQLAKQKLTTYNLLLGTIFISFLLLMLFDHYFYTLDQTQLLLWILLAMIGAEIKITSPKEERLK